MSEQGSGERAGDGDSEEATERIVTTIGTWAGVSTERGQGGVVTFALGPRQIGRVAEPGVVDVALPETVWTRLGESSRVEPHRVNPRSRWASYYLPGHPRAEETDAGPASLDEALWLLRVAYLGHALTLSHTAPGGDVLASIEVEPELRDLDLDPALAAAFDDLRHR